MNAIELNAYRNELAREILETDDIEVLKAVSRVYHRAKNKMMSKMQVQEDLVPYTQRELEERIEEAEAEEGGMPSDVFFSQLEQEMPWLCK